MKKLLPEAVFIGFTGTPLLVEDRKTSLEVFGRYIHTYKFDEAVQDEVVLDLVYEARDVEQALGSQDKIDAWFDAKTKGLNGWQKAALREQWGTMQKVLSSKSRMERIVDDIVFDFGVKPRLSSQRGNAIFVASSIYEACRYFELFQKTPLKGKCAIVTSYNPQAKDVTLEEVGTNTETEKQYLFNTYTELLKSVDPKPGKTKTETYEDDSRKLFIEQPANMRLLIVVDKLLTGFDAPSCTYLYIDKSMQNHGLFQAICRTNRLDGADKPFGHIVDYKDLFHKVQGAIEVYTAELDRSAGGGEARQASGLAGQSCEGERHQGRAICDPRQRGRGRTDILDHPKPARILMKSTIRLGDLAIRVARKDIKNVHLSVHPPSGRVTISAPQRLSLDTIRAFAITRLGWIRDKRRKFREQERQTRRDYIERESHYLWGRRYLLEVVEKDEPPLIAMKGNRLLLQVRPGTAKARRRDLFEEWYRLQLREALTDLVDRWQQRLHVRLAGIHVQRMRTKWGSCNAPRRTIRLNTDLARKPRQCLEYILVHELIHFQARRHDDKFVALMDAHLPNWRHLRQQLNSMPLAHEDWDY